MKKYSGMPLPLENYRYTTGKYKQAVGNCFLLTILFREIFFALLCLNKTHLVCSNSQLIHAYWYAIFIIQP